MSNVRLVVFMNDVTTVGCVKEYDKGSMEPVETILDWLHGPNGYAKGKEVWTRRTRVSTSPWDNEPIGYVEWQHYYTDANGFVQSNSYSAPPKIVLMHLLMRNL